MASNKTALITGIYGQDGAYLAKRLLEQGYKVHGLEKASSSASEENLKHLNIFEKIECHPLDMRDSQAVHALIDRLRPEEIYNLAAQSFVPASWESPQTTFEVNTLGVINLLEAIRKINSKIRLAQAASVEIFGPNQDNNGNVTETTPPNPQSPYAISKLAALLLLKNYRDHYGIFCANAIFSNHESPLRPERFVTRKISSAVARIKLGLEDRMELGDLEATRDWGFAGDYMEGMHLMLNRPKPEDFLFCTGELHTIKDFVSDAFATVGMSDWNKYVSVKAELQRPKNELKRGVGRADRAARLLNWRPKTKFSELVSMMVKADLQRLSNKKT